jgi:hypothetical protein
MNLNALVTEKVKAIEPQVRALLEQLSATVETGSRKVEEVTRKYADMPYAQLSKLPRLAPVVGSVQQLEKSLTAKAFEGFRHYAKVGIAVAQNALPVTKTEAAAAPAAEAAKAE